MMILLLCLFLVATAIGTRAALSVADALRD
jgi:hypothetical protein